MILLSIVVPVYNSSRYLNSCLKSLFEQTLSNIEYIFIDDDSSDDSYQIIERLIEEYPTRKPNVVLRRNKNNLGVAKTREIGMRMARGKYINTCDSDDWYDLDMFENLVNWAENGKYDIVVSDMSVHDNKGNSTIIKAYWGETDPISSLLCGTSIPFINSSVFRKELIQNEEFEYPISDMGDDLILSVQLAIFQKKSCYLPRSFYHYRFNSSSITKSASLDSYIRRTTGLYNNSRQLFHFLQKHNLDLNYEHSIFYFKHRVKSELFPVLGYKEAYELWKTIYPEIVWRVVCDKSFSFRSRLLYALSSLGVYPLYKFLNRFL